MLYFIKKYCYYFFALWIVVLYIVACSYHQFTFVSSGRVLVQPLTGPQKLKKKMKSFSQPSKLKSSKAGVFWLLYTAFYSQIRWSKLALRTSRGLKLRWWHEDGSTIVWRYVIFVSSCSHYRNGRKEVSHMFNHFKPIGDYFSHSLHSKLHILPIKYIWWFYKILRKSCDYFLRGRHWHFKCYLDRIRAKKSNSIMTDILYSQWQGLVSHIILVDTLKNKIKYVSCMVQ